MKPRIIFIALLSSLLGCVELERLPSFTHISDPDSTPEDIGSWKTHVFVFSEGKCKGSYEYESLNDLKNINASEGDLVSIISRESSSLSGYSEMVSGYPESEYRLRSIDGSPIVDRTWGAIFDMTAEDSKISQILKPITSDISINVVDAPEGFNNASLSLKGFSNTWDIKSGEYTSDEEYITGVVMTEGERVTAAILPAAENQKSCTQTLEISVDGESYTYQLALDKSMTTRSRIEISIDFSEYSKDNCFDVEVSHLSIMNPNNVTTTKKTFSQTATGNRHYGVQRMVSGRWQSEAVHDALCSNADKHSYIWNDWKNSKRLRDTMSYCLIDTEFPARIRVRKQKSSFNKVEIRPSIYGIQAEDKGNGFIEFTLPSEAHGKVSVEFDGDRQHNLFIYARRPDVNKPAAGSAGVIYYGKGEHNPGTIYVREGQTLYIDHGAKVYANVKTTGNNVTIAGHGILSGEKMLHHGDNLYSWGDFLLECNITRINARNLTVRDITMIDSPGWNMIVPKTDGAVIDGVNMISWELNGDGIDIVSSRNVEIKNCFLRTYDDAITLKCRFIVNPITDVSDIHIHDCIIWADYARGIVVGPESGNLNSSGRIHDITVKDCIFLQHKRGLNDDLRSAFAIGQGSDGSSNLWSGTNPPRTISNVTVSGLVFDNIDKTGRNVAIWQYGTTPVYMENIRFSNFKVIDKNSNNYPALTIKTNGSRINGLTITDFMVNSQKLTSSSSQIYIDNRNNVSLTVK